jgi:hypothetical protein
MAVKRRITELVMWSFQNFSFYFFLVDHLKTNISLHFESEAATSSGENSINLNELDTSDAAKSAGGQQSTGKIRNVRLVYCGDGVVEECDEDEEERIRIEKEKREAEIEMRKKLDLEAVRAAAMNSKRSFGNVII